jgi:hypothetical protein
VEPVTSEEATGSTNHQFTLSFTHNATQLPKLKKWRRFYSQESKILL